jgi:hypothetical protein
VSHWFDNIIGFGGGALPARVAEVGPFTREKALSRRYALLAGLLLWAASVPAANYADNKALADQLRQLAKTHKSIVRVEKACESIGKNDVWRVELGRGSDEDRNRRPALLVVAGIEGNDLAGTASVVAWMQDLAKGYESDEKIKKLLDATTIHVWPRLNPDAARYFFAKPRREVSTSDRPFDDDHDGLVDEDGPEDLNGDGFITWMRVEDPDGEYIPDPSEPRLMLKADRLKGERGAWRYLTEGRDNDGDKAWNEDGLGGVNFNRNFPYGFKFFAADSGRHQISEVETRALADFVIAHPSIAVAFTFGAADNLVQTPKGEAPKRPPVALHEEDVPWYRELGKAWRETLGLKKELSGGPEPGSFSDWIYFHRGRLSLAARAWSPALQLELARATKAKDEKPKDDGVKKETEPKSDKTDADKDKKPAEKGKDSDTRNEEERAFLKWIDENANEAFIPWKLYEHPDFQGKKVEIGGFAPFTKTNPPERQLGDLAAKHGKFLTELAGKLPRIGIRKAEAKPLGESLYDVTVQVENTGYLPTALAQGGLTREVYPTRVVLKMGDKFILSGDRITMLNAIQGGATKDVRWVVRAKGTKKLDVEIVSMLGGRTQTSIELKEVTR